MCVEAYSLEYQNSEEHFPWLCFIKRNAVQCSICFGGKKKKLFVDFIRFTFAINVALPRYFHQMSHRIYRCVFLSLLFFFFVTIVVSS